MPHRNIAELVLSSARDYAIITLDLEQLVTSWSTGAEAIMGWSADEIIGRPGEIFFTPEDRNLGVPQREFRSARTQGRGMDERWHLRKDGSRFFASGEMLPLLSDGEFAGYLKILRDKTTERLLAQQVKSERDRLQQMFEQSPGFFAMLRGPEHRFEMINPQYSKLIGHRDVIGKPVREALPEVATQGFYGLLDNAYASGEAFVGSAVPIDLQQNPGATFERHYLDFIYQPVRDDNGLVNGIFVQGTDVTNRKEAEDLQMTLNSEIGHRMKNQMAMISSIVRQTLREAGDLDRARETILDRIGVLSSANDLLLANSGSRASVRSVVETSIKFADGLGQSRFHLHGPEQLIGPRAALSLAMIVHELTTNAVKYGALSTEHGQVAVEWLVDNQSEDPQFVFSWSEAGGPPVPSPARIGFGSRLLRGGIAGAVCKVETEYGEQGLSYILEASLHGVTQDN